MMTRRFDCVGHKSVWFAEREGKRGRRVSTPGTGNGNAMALNR